MNDMLMTLGRWQYSPDFNPDEVIGDWIREDVTANTCFATAAKVREKVDAFFAALVERTTEVQHRCRRDLQAQADALLEATSQLLAQTHHVDVTLELVWTASKMKTARPA
jgi:hypothetical protein